jgi:hypothetical protein
MLKMITTSALGWITEGKRAWREKTEDREGQNLKAVIHSSHGTSFCDTGIVTDRAMFILLIC